MAIPDASYDTLLCQFVLHDIPTGERAAVVVEWARVVKYGGVLFLREHLGEHGIHLHDLRSLLHDGGWQEGAWSAGKVPLLGPTYEGTFRR